MSVYSDAAEGVIAATLELCRAAEAAGRENTHDATLAKEFLVGAQAGAAVAVSRLTSYNFGPEYVNKLLGLTE